MSRKTKVNVESLSRAESKKLKKVRETKERQATGLLLLDARQDSSHVSLTRSESVMWNEYFRDLPLVETETAEEASKRRSALKYGYFREMTPRGNI
jgi:hypothetical protein